MEERRERRDGEEMERGEIREIRGMERIRDSQFQLAGASSPAGASILTM